MARPEKHVLVCTHSRAKDDPKGCCADRGGNELAQAFAEEFGAVGSLLIVALFTLLFFRIMKIGRRAEHQQQYFNAYLAYGIALMLSAQAFINMGVNTGLLPTKGLTLPFLSYGGSSLIVCCGLLGMLFRIHREAIEAPNIKSSS